MEKLKHSILKHGFVTFLMATVLFNLYSFVDDWNEPNRKLITDEFNDLIIRLFLAFILVYLLNSMRNGLYFSRDQVVFKKNGKTMISSWQDIQIEKKIYWKVCVLSFYFPQSNYTCRQIIFYGNSDSFKRLTKKYAPEGHKILNI